MYRSALQMIVQNMTVLHTFKAAQVLNSVLPLTRLLHLAWDPMYSAIPRNKLREMN